MKKKIDLTKDNYWSYELGYWWYGDLSRFGKALAHSDLYRKIINLPGSVLEFGVYKATSFIRWLTFREIFETTHSRRIIGFDVFGTFPSDGINTINSDLNFIKKFETGSGKGLSLDEINLILKSKSFTNFELIKGDVRDTLQSFLNKNNFDRYSLIHLDMDVYEPTVFVLDKLFDRLVKGGIIVIDDYNAVEGATIAVDEFLTKHPNLNIEKLPFNKNPSFIVKK